MSGCLKSSVTCLFRILALACAILFVAVTLIVIVAVNVDGILLQPDTYEQALAEQQLYARLPELISEQFTYALTHDPCASNPTRCDINPYLAGSPGLQACLRQAVGEEAFTAIGSGDRPPTEEEAARTTPCIRQFRTPGETGEAGGGPPDYFEKLNADDWKLILSDLLPPEWLQDQTERVLEQLFPYLRAETDKLSLKISLVELKERLLGQEGVELVLRLARTQEPCTSEQMTSFKNFNFETGVGEFPICRPSDAQLALYTPQIELGLETVVRQIPDEADLIQSPLFGGGTRPEQAPPSGPAGDPRAALRLAFTLVKLSWLVPAALLVLIALFGVRSVQGWLRWWGIPLLITGLAGIGLALSGRLFLNWVFATRLTAEAISPSGMAPALTQTGLDLVQSVVHAPLVPIGLAAGFIGAVGFVMVGISLFVEPRG